ncbi:MAG: EsaB/YukD family protein, partial [Pseudonocardia sp.]|nr:EsaB/YukD family protein [Pseudonocardia sp.]
MTRPDAGPAGPGSRPDGTQFCRVTVLAPRSRMDVALPTDLTVAELVPMLTELARESGPRRRPDPPGSPGSSAPVSWCLAAAAGAALPPRATLAGLGVLDGDVLRLRHQADAPPPPVFDDPVDAVAEAVRAPDAGPGGWSSSAPPEPFALRPWDERCRRPAAFAAGGLASASAAALLVVARGLAERPSAVAAVIGALAAGAALTGGMRTARADGPAGVLLAVTAVPLAAAAGCA